MVAPYTGAWIEIYGNAVLPSFSISRSLHGSVDWNQNITSMYRMFSDVAPYTGAWIEISILSRKILNNRSRSLHGSVDWNLWLCLIQCWLHRSLPTRERGLKSFVGLICHTLHPVAPYTGAWIEIGHNANKIKKFDSRSLHGSVDWNAIFNCLNRRCEAVAPYTGAWIEIS